ncbi:hypothetical protein A5675_24740 [Mycobacterium malmoense]|nr:hypothetical protein A5674_11180 [Mycobacterium malmoense]OCB32063.1 hypothetical protein A5675_24740 [Mycobacterium malmoense]
MVFEQLSILVFRQFAKFFRIPEDVSRQGWVVAAVVRVTAGRIAVITRMGVVRFVSVAGRMWPMAVVWRMRCAVAGLVRLAAIPGRNAVVGWLHLGRVPNRCPAVGRLTETGRRFGGRSAHWDGGRLR